MTNQQHIGVGLMALGSFFYALGYVVIKLSVSYGLLNTEAVLIGCCMQLVLLTFTLSYLGKFRFPKQVSIGRIALQSTVAGAALFFNQVGISMANPGNCSLIQACIPLICGPLGLFLGEKLPWVFFICVAVSLGGVINVIGIHDISQREFGGYVLCGLGLICTSAWICIQRVNKMESFLSAFLTRIISVILAGVAFFFSDHSTARVPAVGELGLIFLWAVLLQIPGIMETHAVSLIPVTTSSLLINLTPVFTFIAQALILNQYITLRDLAGIVMVLVATGTFALVKSPHADAEADIEMGKEKTPLLSSPTKVYDSVTKNEPDYISSQSYPSFCAIGQTDFEKDVVQRVEECTYSGSSDSEGSTSTSCAAYTDEYFTSV